MNWREVIRNDTLPTFTAPGEYLKTEPQEHLVGSKVYNLSALFIVAILESIHNTYTRNIDRKRVTDEVNRSSILEAYWRLL